jgi:hypothetical protein
MREILFPSGVRMNYSYRTTDVKDVSFNSDPESFCSESQVSLSSYPAYVCMHLGFLALSSILV